jgi:hypothetical protein
MVVYATTWVSQGVRVQEKNNPSCRKRNEGLKHLQLIEGVQNMESGGMSDSHTFSKCKMDQNGVFESLLLTTLLLDRSTQGYQTNSRIPTRSS